MTMKRDACIFQEHVIFDLELGVVNHIVKQLNRLFIANPKETVENGNTT